MNGRWWEPGFLLLERKATAKSGKEATMMDVVMDERPRQQKSTGKMVPICWLLGKRIPHTRNGNCYSSPHLEATQLSLFLCVCDTSWVTIPLLEPKASVLSGSVSGCRHLKRTPGFSKSLASHRTVGIPSFSQPDVMGAPLPLMSTPGWGAPGGWGPSLLWGRGDLYS